MQVYFVTFEPTCDDKIRWDTAVSKVVMPIAQAGDYISDCHVTVGDSGFGFWCFVEAKNKDHAIQVARQKHNSVPKSVTI